MRLTASFPMYMMPHARPDWDRLWAFLRDQIRSRGISAPDTLTDPAEPLDGHWTDPGLLLSQTCAMPYRQSLHRHLLALGAFDFDLPGCPPGYYCSVLVARRTDARSTAALVQTGRAAVNSRDSQSGYQALVALRGTAPIAPLITGAHAASIRAVATGQADLAAIDAVTWRFLQQGHTDLNDLVIRLRTPPTPGLPLVTARGNDPDPLLAALSAIPHAVATPLGIARFIPHNPGLYDPLA